MISLNATNRSNCLQNATTDQDIGSDTEIYLKSTMRFSVYTTIRGLEVVIGVIGNILTLIIIKKLRNRSNVHMLIMYLAVCDISVSAYLIIGITCDCIMCVKLYVTFIGQV